MTSTPHVPGWVFEYGLAPIEIAVLLNLWRRRNATTEQCFPSTAKIAADVRAGRTSVCAALAKLEEVGLISRNRTGRFGRSNAYVLHEEPVHVANSWTTSTVHVANEPVHVANNTCSRGEHKGYKGSVLNKVLTAQAPADDSFSWEYDESVPLSQRVPF